MTIKPKYLVLSLLMALGGIEPSNAAPEPVDPKVLHIINRLSFGPRPGDIQRVQSMGVESYIKEQLAPDAIPKPEKLKNQLSRLETIHLSTVKVSEYFRTPPNPSPEQKKASQKRDTQIQNEALRARLLRATTSPRQLQEVMVDFWFNHFNVNANKDNIRLWAGSYEQEAIRPHALGRFRDLLGATARHPAMLLYLDNWQNQAGKSSGSNGRLNENYARELMELHTLGANGGYTQHDVIALARIFTGWGFTRPMQQKKHSTGFYFNPEHHDFSDKVFLKQQIKGSGEAEGEQALDILAKSPATARNISYKLAQYFVSDRPPNTLVDRLSKRFIDTDGDITAVLETLFQSPEFWDSKNFNAKFKTPYQYVVSIVRATGMEVNNTIPISRHLESMAMPLYRYRTPEGYPNTQDRWLNPDAMTRRISFATAVANGQLSIAGVVNNQNQSKPVDPAPLVNTLGNSFSESTQQAIASHTSSLRSALILGSPEMMRR
ncbi:MAG: DUF1800 domain-containing protein [Nostoc sp. LLA-1]|nr:DUF1800 domain-containing protein [Cyanocohniella sp. LLY]